MSMQRGRPRKGPFRSLQSGPTALLLGTVDEIKAYEPVLRRAGMTPIEFEIDPPTLDVETIVMDEDLAERITTMSLALIGADVCGDDRLPILSFVDEALPADKIILSSCTQAGVEEQAAICQHGDRLIGVGPLGLLCGHNVVELASGFLTRVDLLQQAVGLFAGAGVEAFQVPDTPGLVLARILMPVVNEAAQALSEGVATAESIDTAMRLGANFPFGPLAWADEIGIDRVLLAMEYLVQATHEERYRPARILRRMAQAGMIGRASGQGFYAYDGDSAAAVSSSRTISENSGTPTTP